MGYVQGQWSGRRPREGVGRHWKLGEVDQYYILLVLVASAPNSYTLEPNAKYPQYNYQRPILDVEAEVRWLIYVRKYEQSIS